MRRALGPAGVLAALAVLLLFMRSAFELVAYPWDWSPDEGLYLDWGIRALRDPGSLYTRSFVPFPAAYGPGLPALLAPLALLGPRMLTGARVLAFAWTLAWAFAVYLLVRRRGGRPLGLAAAALALAALDVSFWSMLVRPDGPMLALWLLAAVVLLPRRLERGADRLDARRTAAGSALLVAAVLTKPLAVVHGAPLVLGWWLVDRKGALRLALAVTALGLGALGLLQLLTDGAFLWLQRVWGLHGTQAGLRGAILWHAGGRLWPYAAVAGAAALVAVRGGERPRALLARSGWLLVAGVVAVLPFVSKYGASWNYLVPLAPALAVLAGQWLEGRGPAAAPLLAAAALALALTRPFPLPSELDRRTATAFYGFVEAYTDARGLPILATRPELVYVVAGQPVEMEGSGFATLARAGAPGTELVRERLRKGEYTLLVTLHALPEAGGIAEAAASRYVHAGGCNLSFYFATTAVHLFVPRERPVSMPPVAGARCGAGTGLPPLSPPPTGP